MTRLVKENNFYLYDLRGEALLCWNEIGCNAMNAAADIYTSSESRMLLNYIHIHSALVIVFFLILYLNLYLNYICIWKKQPSLEGVSLFTQRWQNLPAATSATTPERKLQKGDRDSFTSIQLKNFWFEDGDAMQRWRYNMEWYCNSLVHRRRLGNLTRYCIA